MKYFVILLIFLGGIAVFSAHGQYMGNISDVQPKKSFPMEKIFPPERRMGNNQTLDIIFDLKSQEYVEIPTENLTITFLDVFEDSRCPTDVTCAWAGNAGLRFDISTDLGREITLGTFTNNTGYVFDKYKIQLIDVKPYPTSTNTIKSEDYIASLKVTKDDRIVDPKNTFAKILSPLKQIKSGIALVDVKCNDGKYPAYKHNRMKVACVSEETQNELWSRGWATMRFYTDEDTSPHALCNNYEGKWHPEYEGCRDISDLQCSLMGGKFADGLKICYDGICPENKTYTLCVTNLDLVYGEIENEN